MDVGIEVRVLSQDILIQIVSPGVPVSGWEFHHLLAVRVEERVHAV
jgi:hypothetical protein